MTKSNTGSQRRAVLALGLMMIASASGLYGQTAQALSVPTTSLQFAYQSGQTTLPPAQTIRLFSSPANANFTATVQTGSGGGWLLVNGLTTFSGSTTVNGTDLTISVSPAALAGGFIYSGTVTITSGSISQPIQVTLSVQTTPQLVPNPGSIPLQTVDRGTTTPVPITVTSSSGTPIQFSAEVFSATPGWLAVSPNPATTSATQSVNLIINTSGLPTTTTLLSGAVRFTPAGGSIQQGVTVPITVVVGTASNLQVSPDLVTFVYQPGFAAPGAKPVSVTSSGSTPLSYSAQVGSPAYFYLSSSGASSTSTSLSQLQTPNGFFVVPNIAALGANPAPGNYDSTITIQGLSGTSLTVTARLTVTNQSLLTTSQDFINLNYVTGGPDPAPAAISVGSTGNNQTFTASAIFAPGAAQFFSVLGGTATTPTNISIVPNNLVIRGLANGTYTGQLRLQSTSIAGATPVNIPVTLTVGGSTQLSVDTPQPAPFEGALGQAQTARTLIVRSVDPNVIVNFSVSVDYGSGPGSWISLSSLTGVTGAPSGTLTYNINPNAITTAGNYSADIVITPIGVATPLPVRVNIRYNVTAAATVTATPARLDLTQAGTTVPANQTVQLTTTAGSTAFTTQVNPGGTDPVFVRVLNSSATTIPGALQLAIESSALPPRTEPYLNNVVVIPNNGSGVVTIPVRLTVSAGPVLTAAPNTLTFNYASGSANPAAQTVNLTSSAGAVAFTAAATTTTGGNWLAVTPASGTTNAAGGAPVPLSITVTPTGLTPAAYNGTVTVTPAGSQPITIPVTLTVTAPAPPNGVTLSNAGSAISRGVSPGEIITIRGRNMAPSTGLIFQVQNNAVPTRLGEVRVTFDGVEAPLLYVGPSGDRTNDQINAIVPYGVSGRASTNVVVEYRGIASQPVSFAVRETDPGLFTADSTGSGLASVLNADSSVNSQTNPATAGTIIQLFGTGEGLVGPSPGDGRVVPTTPPFPVILIAPVVRVNGREARIVYAGSAPGLVAGVFQINAELPQDLGISALGSVPVTVQIGTSSSQPGVTIWASPRQ